MGIIRHGGLKWQNVHTEGALNTTKSNVIGPTQGWPDHTLRVFRIGPGGSTPHHRHDWEHVNYIIRGKGTLTIGGNAEDISAGDFAFVPPNVHHHFKNPSDEDFEFICIVPNRGA